MIRLVTFVAVLDMAEEPVPERSVEVGDEASSSTVGTDPGGINGTVVLALPKVSFHLEGFLVTGAGG